MDDDPVQRDGAPRDPGNDARRPPAEDHQGHPVSRRGEARQPPDDRGSNAALPDLEGSLIGRLLRLEDPDASVRRVRRNALVLLVLATAAVAAVTRSPWQTLATLVPGTLMLLSFQAIVAFSDGLVNRPDKGPSPLQAGLLALRYVLLGLVLCAMFLLPGVGPIPVLLGLSILVLAILLEAISQALLGGPGPP